MTAPQARGLRQARQGGGGLDLATLTAPPMPSATGFDRRRRAPARSSFARHRPPDARRRRPSGEQDIFGKPSTRRRWRRSRRAAARWSGGNVERQLLVAATAGPATAWSATAGPAAAGPATPGPATPGPAAPGPATPGAATPGPATPGRPRSGTSRPSRHLQRGLVLALHSGHDSRAVDGSCPAAPDRDHRPDRLREVDRGGLARGVSRRRSVIDADRRCAGTVYPGLVARRTQSEMR